MRCLSAMSTFKSENIFSSSEIIIISSEDDSDDKDVTSEDDVGEEKHKVFIQSAYYPFNSPRETSPILIEDSDEEEVSFKPVKNEEEQEKTKKGSYRKRNLKTSVTKPLLKATSRQCRPKISKSPVIVEDSDEEIPDLNTNGANHPSPNFQDKNHTSEVCELTYPVIREDSDEEFPDFCLSFKDEGMKVNKTHPSNVAEPSLKVIKGGYSPLKFMSPVTKENSEEFLDLCLWDQNEGNQMNKNKGGNSPISKKRNQNIAASQSQSPFKILKVDNELISQSETPFGLDMLVLKKKISNSILRGGLKGQNVIACNRTFTSCYETHKNQVKCIPTPPQTKALFEIMMDDENLQLFALRAIHRTLSQKQYLDPSLLNLLLEYLFGCDLKQEVPSAEGLHLGISILHRCLNSHPPCKEGMHTIYLKMCQDWFKLLLQKVDEALLKGEPNVSEGVILQEQDKSTLNESEESFYDYTSVIRRKAIEKKEKYLRITKAEKLQHLSVLTKYFSKVMLHSFLEWSIHHWQQKSSALFRKDICPILSEIVWGSSTWSSEWGSVNPVVQNIFALYCRTSNTLCLHESFGNVIAICAAILHRKEMSAYPEMGQMTRSYAYKLYMEIKSSLDVGVNLRNLHPDWLKFQVGCSFLGVNEPANFYTAKERISKVLQDKDRCKDANSTFCVETVCVEVIKAMMGMMQLKSSIPEDCDLTEKIVEENSSWFSQNLQDEKIFNQLKMIQNTLCLPCIKNRKWFFDGFEN